MTTPVAAPSTDTHFAHRTVALFVISVLGLFVELMLIRWVSTEIRLFAYLQNTVLVVCFLGLGMGCWTCRQPAQFRETLVWLLFLAVLLGLPWTRSGLGYISEMFSVLEDFHIWEGMDSKSSGEALLNSTLATVLTFVLMVILWSIFVPLGRILGRLMDDHPRPVQAYSVNVAGSLIGIGLFVALSALYSPPWVWCLVVAVLAIPFLTRGERTGWVLLIGIVAASVLPELFPDSTRRDSTGAYRREGDTAFFRETDEVLWSPYQKLHMTSMTARPREGNSSYTYHVLEVNNSTYMSLQDLSPRATQDPRHAFLFDPAMRDYGYYDLATRLCPQPERMLIVGSGGGNDVAGGLRGGAKRIVAVEIDPAIIALGRKYHPEKPYDDSRVAVVNDDARAYFANSAERFELILFGLLDSHTTTAMTNARLDHYVYTRESLTQARRLLTDDGIMVLSFAVERPYLADRIGTALREVFGKEPLVFRVPQTAYGLGGVVFVTGNLDKVRQQRLLQPKLDELLRSYQSMHPVRLTGTTKVAEDDWPYIYLEKPLIPVLFYLLAGLMPLLFLYGLYRLQTGALLREWQRDHWHFFFLGAAFMLLESQNISKAAVALGNTWDVNAVIIASILILILLANFLGSRWPRLPLSLVYLALLACCLGLFFFDLSMLVSLPYAPRAVIVGSLTCLPMLFSGVVFIRSFVAAAHKDRALGANLLGALVGGLLQYVTFMTGIRALLLFVAVLYLAAWLTQPRVAAAQAKPS